MKSLMTIVVPCYNEEEVLPLFMDALTPVRKQLSEDEVDTEIIFIDDGSKDSTLELLRSFHREDPSVRYISFSRNFGKEAGIYAGLKESHGDHVVLLDADLQHPVEYIPVMYKVLTGGSDAPNAPVTSDKDNTGKAEASCPLGDGRKLYDSVAMYRCDRNGESRIRSFFSKRFYRLMNKMSKISLVDGATDFRMMTRQMVDAVVGMEEYNRFTKGIFNWVGFNTYWMPYSNVERKAGKSKWSFSSLIRYSFEGMFAFSTTPLTISFALGILFCLIALILAVYVVIKTLIWGDPVAGFPTLFCIIVFFGGIQLLFLGIIGQYLSKMYMEVKHRPKYIVKETSV